jgi:hypothetical protein
VFSTWSVPRCYKQDKSRISELTIDRWSIALVVGQSPVGKNVRKKAEDIAGIRHQATTGEDRAGWEDLVSAVVNSRLCELAIAL